MLIGAGGSRLSEIVVEIVASTIVPPDVLCLGCEGPDMTLQSHLSREKVEDHTMNSLDMCESIFYTCD